MTSRARAGMTLIELVIAIAITGIVTALGYGAFASMVDHRAAMRTATLDTERAAALREMLDEWMTSGIVMVSNDPPPISLSPGNNDQFVLGTTALTPAFGPRTFLRFLIDDNPATPERGLTMQYPTGRGDTLAAREVEPAIVGLQVEFLDRRTGRWYPAREAATIQPIAIRVTLEGAADAPLPPLLRLPLIAPVGDDPVERRT